LQFDTFGNTGGCQAIYSVIPPLTTPSCANVTFPTALGVSAEATDGPLSEFGWPSQVFTIFFQLCLSPTQTFNSVLILPLLQKTGHRPTPSQSVFTPVGKSITLSISCGQIAPSLHPPYNITSNSTTVNWTVSLVSFHRIYILIAHLIKTLQDWASPFFISVVDSLGSVWSNGPLHSGQGISSSCLAASAQ